MTLPGDPLDHEIPPTPQELKGPTEHLEVRDVPFMAQASELPPGSPPDPAVIAGSASETAERLPNAEVAPDETSATVVHIVQEISPAPLEVVDVEDLDWQSVLTRSNPSLMRSNMRPTVEKMEALLDQADGPGMLFDQYRADVADKAIKIPAVETGGPLWFIGDLHGDMLALEAALAAIEFNRSEGAEPRIVFLGDLFDDEGFGLEVLLRVFELVADAPGRICVLAGNHDEALSYDGVRFASSVSPSDFAEFLNANLAHEWIERTGKLAVRLFANAPRALFFPDGLLAAHGGFPLVDLHPQLAERGNWNDVTCLSDFVWTRAHPKARRKLPNRFTRGSQFGYEDFAAFCSLSAALGRPVSRMVRGHDHVEDRYATFSAYKDHPLLTTVALSHRLSRESFGPYERVPTVAQFIEGTLPRVYRLHIPTDVIREVYPELQPDAVLNETIEGPQA